MTINDEWLKNTRHFEPASADFANRIIFAARPRAPRATFGAFLQELVASVLPQPAFALAAVLTIGVIAGLNMPSALSIDNHDPILQAYSDDEGTTL